MWIENTINEILQFVKRFFGMFIKSFFAPFELLRDIRNQQPKLIRSSVYFFIALLLYTFYITARMHNVHYSIPTKISQNKVIEIAATDASVNFNLKAFLYVLPITLLFHLLITLLLRIIKVPRIEKKYYINYIYIWSGSAFLLNAILDIIKMLLVDNPQWILGASPANSDIEAMRIIIITTRNHLVWIVVLACSTYAIIKHYRRAWKPLVVPFIAAMSLAYSYQSVKLLYDYFARSDKKSLSFKSAGPDGFIDTVFKKDSIGDDGTASMTFYIFNDSDSTFVLPSYSSLFLTSYSEDEVKLINQGRDIKMPPYPERYKIERDKVWFHLSPGAAEDTMYIIKPKDILKVKFMSRMTKCYFNSFYRSGVEQKYAELTFIIPVNSTWEQFWPQKTVGQDVDIQLSGQHYFEDCP